MTAIFKREIRAYFSSPVGYVCVAALAALYGFAYYVYVMMGRSTDNIPHVYSFLFAYGSLVLPLLTMRSMSEERKNKTDQALLTAPVGTGTIVAAKFFAAFFVYFIASVIGLLPAFAIFPFVSGAMPFGILFGNFIANLLYGGAIIAIGIFISSLTESQVIAAVGTFIVTFFLMYMNGLSSSLDQELITKIVGWISFYTRYQAFLQGIFDVPSTVFFVSVILLFNFLTAKRLESRRWS